MIDSERERNSPEVNFSTVDWFTVRLEEAQVLIEQGLNSNDAVNRLVSSNNCTPELASHLDFIARCLIPLNR